MMILKQRTEANRDFIHIMPKLKQRSGQKAKQNAGRMRGGRTGSGVGPPAARHPDAKRVSALGSRAACRCSLSPLSAPRLPSAVSSLAGEGGKVHHTAPRRNASLQGELDTFCLCVRPQRYLRFSLACGVEGAVAILLLAVVAEQTSLGVEVVEQTSLSAEVECAAEEAAAAQDSESAAPGLLVRAVEAGRLEHVEAAEAAVRAVPPAGSPAESPLRRPPKCRCVCTLPARCVLAPGSI